MTLNEDINITVKANLVVDDQTFRTCLNLIDIHMQTNNVSGIVIASGKHHGGNVGVTPLLTEEELNAAAMAKFNIPVKNKEESNVG